MPNSFRWVESEIPSLKTVTPLMLGPEDPPELPSPRPRPLTPSADNDLTMHSQDDSPLFNRLPLEIRLEIYRFLFGDRTLHIELSYDRLKAKGLRHAGWNNERRPDQNLEWRWISCTCCDDSGMWWRDPCLKGGASLSCEGQDGIAHDPSACKVNAKWLLTCRRGYAESIAILYETNTFNIPFSIYDSLENHQKGAALGRRQEGTHHMPFLARAIPSHRFSTITSLEVAYWFIEEPPRPSNILALAAYETSWHEMVLPGLRKLKVAADTYPFPNGKKGASVGEEAAWFGVVDDIVSERSLDLEFRLPLTWFINLRRGSSENWYDGNDCTNWKYWRTVGQDETVNSSDAKLGYRVATLG